MIVTCGAGAVPYSWIAQTRPGGVILGDVHGIGIVRLTVADDGTAGGHFLGWSGRFMSLRQSANSIDESLPALTPDELHGLRESPSELDPAVLVDESFAFFLKFFLGSGRSDHYVIDDQPKSTVIAHDGSWAETVGPARDGGYLVRFDGTHNPWHTVEAAHTTWLHLGRPQPTEFGLTVTNRTQYVWHRTPGSGWTHHLR